MIEIKVDKSEPEGNGFATDGKVSFGNYETNTPFKSTSIAKTNADEYTVLERENLHSPREYFALVNNKEHAFNLFGEKEESLQLRAEFHENINKTLEKIKTKKDFNFVYLYFKEPLPKINRKIAENIFDVLDSPYNHLLVIPTPPEVDNIETVKELIDVFKTRKSMVNLERPCMGLIPRSINENSIAKLIDVYAQNGINVFGLDANGARPRGYILNLIRRKIDENTKIKKNNYLLYVFNSAKSQYIRRDVRPINDILTVMYGIDGFNNQRFARGGSKWTEMLPKQQQERIENIRFRITDDYGEYNKNGLLESKFNFDKSNETSILNRKNFESIYNIERTKKAYDALYDSSKSHNWILTHRELDVSVKKEIENKNLLKYFKGKKYIESEVNSFLSENPNLK